MITELMDMLKVGDHVGRANRFAPRPGEGVGRRIHRVPLRNHVVIRDVLNAISDRNEVGRLRIPRTDLAMHRVEQAVGKRTRDERPSR